MRNLLKLGCVAIYLAALAAWVGLLPGSLGRVMEIIAVGMLLLHALELVFVFEHVRRYRGPLATSVLLTLIFGLLHWKPLADEAKTGLAPSMP
jgi:uncharacterized protein YhhL (DUF1145 family)